MRRILFAALLAPASVSGAHPQTTSSTEKARRLGKEKDDELLENATMTMLLAPRIGATPSKRSTGALARLRDGTLFGQDSMVRTEEAA
jgi:hypothetical protein